MSQKGDCWFLDKKDEIPTVRQLRPPQKIQYKGVVEENIFLLNSFWTYKNWELSYCCDRGNLLHFCLPPVLNQLSDFKLTANLLSFAALKRVEILRSRLLLIVAISDKLQSELRINASGAFLKHVPGMVKKSRNSDDHS